MTNNPEDAVVSAAQQAAGDVEYMLLACRPVEPSAAERVAQTQFGINLDVPYDGSIRESCLLCMRAVWLGPRQQAVREAEPDRAVVCCLTCAITAASAEGDPQAVPVHSLGSIHPTDG